MLVWVLQHTWKTIHQSPLDARIIHLTHTQSQNHTHTHGLAAGAPSSDLEALEHVEVLLSELEVLGQQSEGLRLLELSGPQEAEDEVVIRPQEADVGPGHDHVPDLRRHIIRISRSRRRRSPRASQHLLDVLVEGFRVLVQLHSGFLRGLGAQAGLQVRHHGFQTPCVNIYREGRASELGGPGSSLLPHWFCWFSS